MGKAALVIIGIIVLLGIIIFGSGVSGYNTLTTRKQNVDAQWAQVENQMQRRADLIPNIVATVKGIAGLEERVFTSIAQARSQLLSTLQNPNSSTEDKISADNKLSQAMREAQLIPSGGGILGTGGRFLSLTENYPQLKSNESFMKLQDELAGTENRLAVSRRDYNQAVQDYNTTRNKFPTVIIANFLNFQEKPYFKADEGARQAPKVDFSR